MPSEIIETILVPENKIFIVPEYYRDHVTTLYWDGAEVAEVLDETPTNMEEHKMIRCIICGKESYVDGSTECSECARLRGYDDIELKRKIRRLEAEIDNHTYPGTTSTGHRVRQHTGQQWREYVR